MMKEVLRAILRRDEAEAFVAHQPLIVPSLMPSATLLNRAFLLSSPTHSARAAAHQLGSRRAPYQLPARLAPPPRLAPPHHRRNA